MKWFISRVDPLTPNCFSFRPTTLSLWVYIVIEIMGQVSPRYQGYIWNMTISITLWDIYIIRHWNIFTMGYLHSPPWGALWHFTYFGFRKKPSTAPQSAWNCQHENAFVITNKCIWKYTVIASKLLHTTN